MSGWWSGEIVTMVTARASSAAARARRARISRQAALAYDPRDDIFYHKLPPPPSRISGYATDMEEFRGHRPAALLSAEAPRYAATASCAFEGSAQKFDS